MYHSELDSIDIYREVSNHLVKGSSPSALTVRTARDHRAVLSILFLANVGKIEPL